MIRTKKMGRGVAVLVLISLCLLQALRGAQRQSLAVNEIRYLSPAEERFLAKPLVLEVEGNRLFILDSQERKIKVYSLEGKWLYDIGRYGAGPGEFMHPADMSLTEDEAAVLDSEAYQVKFFTLPGNFIGSFKIGFRGYRLLQVNQDRIVVSRLPKLNEKNISLLYYFDRQGKLIGEALKVSSSGNSSLDFFELSHDLRSVGRMVAVIRKCGQEPVTLLDDRANPTPSLKIDFNYPSLSFQVNLPKVGQKRIQGFAFASAVSGEEIYLVCPAKQADGDLGPSSRVAVLGLKGEIRHFIEFPLPIYKLAVSQNRFFIIDEEGQLRIFDLAGDKTSTAESKK